MPIDPSIALGVQPMRLANPLDLAMGVQQMRSQRLENQVRQEALDKAANANAIVKAQDEAMRGASGLDDYLARLTQAGHGHLAPTIRKQWTEADESAQKAKKARADAEIAEADYFGSLAASAKQWEKDGPEAVQNAALMALSHAKRSGHDTSQIEDALKQNPAALPQVLEALMQASPAQRGLLDKERGTGIQAQTAATTAANVASQIQTADAARPGVIADSALKAQITAGSRGGVTPAQQLTDKREQQRISLEQQRVALDRQRAADAKTDKTTLSPEGLDAAAMMFAKTGQLPALGAGDKDTRKHIINRAAVLMPGLDIASAKADFNANSDSLRTIQKQRDAIAAFEQTAKKNIDVFLETAGKVVDTGSPMANTAARLISGKMLGSPDQAAFDAARQVAINEIAKITSNPTLAGQLSDSARHEVEAFNPGNATLKQSVAVMRLLKRDMDNRITSLDEQIGAIQGRIKKAGTPEASAKPSGGPKVGDVVEVGGKKIKISAIHPDGTFDGSEVK